MAHPECQCHWNTVYVYIRRYSSPRQQSQPRRWHCVGRLVSATGVTMLSFTCTIRISRRLLQFAISFIVFKDRRHWHKFRGTGPILRNTEYVPHIRDTYFSHAMNVNHFTSMRIWSITMIHSQNYWIWIWLYWNIIGIGRNAFSSHDFQYSSSDTRWSWIWSFEVFWHRL